MTTPTPSRRRFLGGLVAAGAAGLAAPLLPSVVSVARGRAAASATPLRHVLISCQENRSFDHYFGYDAISGAYGVPPGYTQPDGQGGAVVPSHLTSGVSADPHHQWTDIHAEWRGGAMDGFYTTNGSRALGYYSAADLPLYYALAGQFTLCANYFCSVLGGTYPNRLYLCGGTGGGNTSNSIATGSLTYPMILDSLDAAGVTWKNYNTGLLPAVAQNNAMVLFARWANDPRMNNDLSDLLGDLRHDTLPQVSFLNPGLFNSEHAPTSIQTGQSSMLRVVRALVASPYARRGHLEAALYEHSSALKFLEAVFGLPTLASLNHAFDTATPTANNQAVPPGATAGPPAPPRDGRADIGALLECFNFGQNPAYRPHLPSLALTEARAKPARSARDGM